MEEAKMSEYAVLTGIPCDSPMNRIDPEDLFAVLMLFMIFGSDPAERNMDEMKAKAKELIAEIKKEVRTDDVRQSDERA